MNDKRLDYVIEDLKELKADVKLLLAKENRRVGMAIALSCIATSALTILELLFLHK